MPSCSVCTLHFALHRLRSINTSDVTNATATVARKLNSHGPVIANQLICSTCRSRYCIARTPNVTVANNVAFSRRTRRGTRERRDALILGSRDASSERLALDELRRVAGRHGIEMSFFVPDSIIKSDYNIDPNSCQSFHTAPRFTARLVVELALSAALHATDNAANLAAPPKFFPCISSETLGVLLIGHPIALLQIIGDMSRDHPLPCHQRDKALLCNVCHCGSIIPAFSEEYIRQLGIAGASAGAPLPVAIARTRLPFRPLEIRW